MAQLIDKSTIVANIEKRIKINKGCMLGLRNLDYYQGKIDALNDTISFLYTLKTKEVDLEKEIEYIRNDFIEAKEVDFEEELISLIEKEKAFVTDNREVKYYNGDSFNHIYELEFIAKHFFELGLKVQKGGEE